jgi:hypothetical protein
MMDKMSDYIKQLEEQNQLLQEKLIRAYNEIDERHDLHMETFDVEYQMYVRNGHRPLGDVLFHKNFDELLSCAMYSSVIEHIKPTANYIEIYARVGLRQYFYMKIDNSYDKIKLYFNSHSKISGHLPLQLIFDNVSEFESKLKQ